MKYFLGVLAFCANVAKIAEPTRSTHDAMRLQRAIIPSCALLAAAAMNQSNQSTRALLLDSFYSTVRARREREDLATSLSLSLSREYC